jgi:hypothetical protein
MGRRATKVEGSKGGTMLVRRGTSDLLPVVYRYLTGTALVEVQKYIQEYSVYTDCRRDYTSLNLAKKGSTATERLTAAQMQKVQKKCSECSRLGKCGGRSDYCCE